MRAWVIWPLFVFAIVTAEYMEDEHTWVEEDDPYESGLEQETTHERFRRDVQYDPYEEHVRVKRCEDAPVHRVRRSDDYEYIRRPRQVHQYEVHEANDDAHAPSSLPYEEMLAASADHYHRVYAAPGAASARYHSEVSDSPVPAAPVPAAPVPAAPVPAAPVPIPVYRQPVPSKLSAADITNNVSPVRFTNLSPINIVPVPVSVSHSSSGSTAPGLGPVGYVPVVQTLQQLAGDDQSTAGAAHHKHHAHGHAQGGGHKNMEHHHRQHGGKSSKGYHSDQHVDKGGKGHKTKELHRKEFEEADGLKKKHHDHAGHKGSHEEEAHGQKGAKFDEKKGHKKGHKTKGYHNKYHKDEFHKEHKFYDDYHKSGEHHRYGKFNAKHASNESGKKKAHHINAGHDHVERGKKGFSNKGHVDSDHKGHKGSQGHEEHHQHHEQHGKKGGKEGGSHWGYKKP